MGTMTPSDGAPSIAIHPERAGRDWDVNYHRAASSDESVEGSRQPSERVKPINQRSNAMVAKTPQGPSCSLRKTLRHLGGNKLGPHGLNARALVQNSPVRRDALIRNNMTNSDRDDFQETIQELSGLLAQPHTYEQVVWKVEYLSLSDWYHFYGMVRNGQASGLGHVYDRLARRAKSVQPDEFISIALGFHANAGILKYGGKRSVGTDILEEIETRGVIGAEVIRLGLEAKSKGLQGRNVMSVTDIAFIGLRNNDHTHLLESLTSGGPSIKWCRDRRFISASSAMSIAGTH